MEKRLSRKDAREIVESIMNVLESDPQTIDTISKKVESSWSTVWYYLKLIDWVQRCPKVGRVPIGKRIELWRREWGRLPT